ncbi:Asp23/Gls24 family protein [Streptomyces sp. NTH33]|uniref:Asp23/Gls24 family envelope stress response protein n=1 Tax=Streptomyces sp. NTH33 TaxID=1735453 RepID=UPI000DA90CA6|nr:Asp23/Gls24 family envelope stress response protein [Streptomyces sp. NTH33]PZG90160.1 Asp23/Gls24 family protein [Streptomyces sp. NTH33]
MSTPDAGARGTGPVARAQAGGLPAPRERGATVIPDRVVARIAARVVRTVQERRAALPPEGRTAAPTASAATRGGSVRLSLALDLPYPADLAGMSQRIQRDVAERVTALTGLEVGEVTVTIRRLVPHSGLGRGRRVQ